jgi:hypothetical protein
MTGYHLHLIVALQTIRGGDSVWIPYTSLSKNGKKIVENILQNIYV